MRPESRDRQCRESCWEAATEEQAGYSPIAANGQEPGEWSAYEPGPEDTGEHRSASVSHCTQRCTHTGLPGIKRLIASAQQEARNGGRDDGQVGGLSRRQGVGEEQKSQSGQKCPGNADSDTRMGS